MNEFKAGDVVRLKSGGPRMTVKWSGKTMTIEEGVCCTWFEQPKNVLKEEVFEAITLAKAKLNDGDIG